MRARVLRFALCAALAGSQGCGPAKRPPSSGSAAPASTATAQPPIGITILYTSDEHGWLEPAAARKTRHGGVAQLLHQLVSQEQHCAGAFQGTPLPDCSGSSTLLLSGGDNYTGPAISGLFRGRSMASVLRRLGYAASAFGNHELDFGLPAFVKNRAEAEIPYLAANIVRVDDQAPELAEPYRIVERNGARIGVVGVSTTETPKAAASHRFRGLRFDDVAATLDRVVPELWAKDVDAVVLLAHECHEVIAPLVAGHPEWELSFAGTGHCHRTSVELAGGVPVIAPSWRLEHYGRVRLKIFKSRPAKDRAELHSYELVEVVSDAAKPAPSSDAGLDRRLGGWASEVEAKLGEVIGHSAKGIAKRSPLLGRWIVRAWRERLGAEVAITTKGGIRQEMPAGAITLATVHSIMPFENQLISFRISGQQLAPMLAGPMVIVDGLARDGEGFRIDPKRSYQVVTTDFLFWGGDGLDFHRRADNPKVHDLSWRDPVIEWTRALGSTAEQPLERRLAMP